MEMLLGAVAAGVGGFLGDTRRLAEGKGPAGRAAEWRLAGVRGQRRVGGGGESLGTARADCGSPPPGGGDAGRAGWVVEVTAEAEGSGVAWRDGDERRRAQRVGDLGTGAHRGNQAHGVTASCWPTGRCNFSCPLGAMC